LFDIAIDGIFDIAIDGIFDIAIDGIFDIEPCVEVFFYSTDRQIAVSFYKLNLLDI